MRDITIPRLGAHAVGAALDAAGVAPDEVDELVLGVNLPGSDRSIARQTQLLAKIPDDRVSYTVDRACCSSMAAITLGTRAIQANDGKIVVAGGAENMSRVPYFLEGLRWGNRIGDVNLKDQLVISCPHTGVPRAVQAANEALEYNIDREAQDAWALRSQQRCKRALELGLFESEIVPIHMEVPGGFVEVTADEAPRINTTAEQLAALPLANGSLTVTAGNAPGLNTGATSVVMMSARQAMRRQVEPLCEVLATAMASGHPARIASIPAQAASKALEAAGLGIEEVDLLEINEAFAAVPLVTTHVLGGGDRALVARLRERTNVNGGAVAIGHPTGATAARMVMTLAYELRRRGGGVGLATICGGIGESEAVLIRVD